MPRIRKLRARTAAVSSHSASLEAVTSAVGAPRTGQACAQRTSRRGVEGAEKGWRGGRAGQVRLVEAVEVSRELEDVLAQLGRQEVALYVGHHLAQPQQLPRQVHLGRLAQHEAGGRVGGRRVERGGGGGAALDAADARVGVEHVGRGVAREGEHLVEGEAVV